jgi:tetratricopeptide (TPR) repeat protein
MRFQQSFLSTLLLFLSTGFLPAFSTDSFAEAKNLYARGQYAQAANLLNSFLIGHPDDAAAQYYLGCSYVGLHRDEDAVEHYQRAIKLGPKSTVATYSRDEISRIKALVPKSSDTYEPIPAVAKDVKVAVPTESKTITKSPALTAVHTVNQQTDESEKRLQDEYEAKIKQVRLDAQVQIDRLNASKKEEIAELGPGVRGRNGTTIWRPDTEPVRNAYQARIDDVNKNTDRKIAELNLECKSRIDKLEQFAVDSSRAYSGHDMVGASRSNPASSNLHVHNYEIEADVSGNPTPLIAAPQKLPAAKTSAR